MDDYDVVVVGGGLAALTAGLFAARYGRSTLVLMAGVPGGHLLNVEKIEDFPGFPEGVSGYELGPMVQEQAANQGAEFRMAEARSLEPLDGDWLVRADDGERFARAVIIAAGSKPRALGVPGEDRLQGRGLSHCASCDGPLFRGKTVGVVGGGDSALQEALTLAGHAEQVIIFHRGDLSSAQTYQQRTRENPRIHLRPNTVVEEIFGESAVTGVRARDLLSGDQAEVELAGLFVYVGLEPNTGFVQGQVPLDPAGRIPTDLWMRTPVRGLFAAGDIRADSASQAITTAGDGATAAIAAHRYLETGEWPGG